MGFISNFSVITASLGNLGDRFLTAGYKDEIGFADKAKRASKIKDLKGFELCYGLDNAGVATQAIKKILQDNGLCSTAVNSPLSSGKRWALGTLSALEQQVRREALDISRATIDFTSEIGCPLVNFWLGQDGFDYPFQVNYQRQWQNLIDAIRELADYQPQMLLSLEFKPREPRNRALLNTAATTMLALREIDRQNVGLTIDTGHVLQSGENMAQVVELCARSQKLFNLHLNDNYAAWDDDLVVGSVHLFEYLELVYALRKVGYERWCAIDIFPYREDAFEATERSIRFMQAYDRWVDKIGFDRLSQLIQTGSVSEILRDVSSRLFA